MANYHILANRADGNQLRVVFHLSVPDIDNAAGINYRTALTLYLGNEWNSIVPTALLGTGEQDALSAGSLYEHPWTFNTYPGETLLEKRNRLDAKHIAFSSTVIEQLQTRLEYYGYGRDIP